MTTIGPRCQEILLVLTIIMILIIPAIYVIAGIFILIDDHEIYKECDKTSDLHVYVILSIFTFFLNSCCYNSFEKEHIMFFPVNLLLLIEISLIVWGFVEIFFRIDNCPGLKYSDLYIYAIITWILQIIFLIYFNVKYFYEFIYNYINYWIIRFYIYQFNIEIFSKYDIIANKNDNIHIFFIYVYISVHAWTCSGLSKWYNIYVDLGNPL